MLRAEMGEVPVRPPSQPEMRFNRPAYNSYTRLTVDYGYLSFEDPYTSVRLLRSMASCEHEAAASCVGPSPFAANARRRLDPYKFMSRRRIFLCFLSIYDHRAHGYVTHKDLKRQQNLERPRQFELARQAELSRCEAEIVREPGITHL